MDQITLAQLKQSLEAERERLIGELKGIARPDAAGHIGEWETQYPQFEAGEAIAAAAPDEEADEVEEYEARLATERSLENRLLEVTHALERMAGGTYGTCLACKQPIPPARLRANPAAAYDIEHEVKTF